MQSSISESVKDMRFFCGKTFFVQRVLLPTLILAQLFVGFRNPGGAYLERMLFHWPEFYCVRKAYRQEKCLNYFGHRKYVVNPRKVEVIQVHRPMEPKHGGVDLETTVLYTNHFQVGTEHSTLYGGCVGPVNGRASAKERPCFELHPVFLKVVSSLVLNCTPWCDD